MTRVLFLVSDGRFTGFSVKGHASDTAFSGTDIVCSAVSSAVYFAANTATDVFGAKADITVSDARFVFSLKGENDESAERLLKGLAMHFIMLSRQYPDNLKVRIINTTHNSEVHNHA